MAFCAKCGANVEEKYKFCSVCGFPIKVASAEAVPVNETRSVPVVQANRDNTTVKDQNKSVSVAAYFGLILLYMIPVIGLVSCIIVSFAAANKNLKSFSRGFLIYSILNAMITGVIIMIIGAILTSVINTLQSYVIGLTTGAPGNFLKLFFEAVYLIGQFLGYYPA